MSLSTTTSATYELVKYSKAYSPTAATPNAGPADLEWQHFSNPIIRLSLDERKASSGRLESYRLRIIWMLSAVLDAMDVDQRDVVFVRHGYLSSS